MYVQIWVLKKVLSFVEALTIKEEKYIGTYLYVVNLVTWIEF